MCGAISIPYDPSFAHELLKFFSKEDIKHFEKNGEVVFAYWDKRPVLPVKTKDGVALYEWGNRDSALALPQTGWARLESLLANKWKHLNPKVVLIPAAKGCEKKHWFDLSQDIKAVLVQKGGVQRVYMITEAASKEFKELTGHDRMPRLHLNNGGN